MSLAITHLIGVAQSPAKSKKLRTYKAWESLKIRLENTFALAQNIYLMTGKRISSYSFNDYLFLIV